MESQVYNIPLELLGDYPTEPLVVRSASPEALVAGLEADDLARIEYVQLLAPEADPKPLVSWASGLPVDVVLDDPAEQFGVLYRLAPLLERHPVRVTIAVVTGFSKAVHVAAALRFDVKLRIGQPDRSLAAELAAVLDLYLHGPAVSRPIEFFHSTFLAMLTDAGPTLWTTQEEDPALFRYVGDDGRARRPWVAAPEDDVEAFARAQVEAGGQCASCEHLPVCKSFFKRGNPDYDCRTVQSLFDRLRSATVEMAGDLHAARADFT